MKLNKYTLLSSITLICVLLPNIVPMKADGTEVRNLLISQISNQKIQTPTETAGTGTEKLPTTSAAKSTVQLEAALLLIHPSK